MSKKPVLICPVCGYTAASNEGIQFCPHDESYLRPKVLGQVAARDTSAFETGWQRMRERLRQPQTFKTIKEHALFKARFIPPATVEVTPLSTGRPRPITKTHLRNVYQHWINGKSLTTTHYTKITKHSVYILTLLTTYFQ